MLCQLPKQREKGMRTHFGWTRGPSSQSVRNISDEFETIRSVRLSDYQSALEAMSGDEILTISHPSELPPRLNDLIETWIRTREHQSL
jgi:hypothetical protein